MTKSALKRRRHNANARRRYQERAARNVSLGFTARGRPRKTLDSKGRKIGQRYYIEAHGKSRHTILNRLWRQRNISIGLRCDGKPLKFKRHRLPRATTPEQRRANARARWKFYVNRWLAAGRNSRNQPRKDFLAPTALELQWREFRSSLQLPEPANWSEAA